MEKISLHAYEEVPLQTPAAGIHGLHLLLVNVYALQGDGQHWTLVDTGLPLSASRIRRWTEKLFGRHSRPNSIVITHGHFDHVSSLKELAEAWDVPIYAHAAELPYITGQQKYPPPDATVGGGLFAILSPLYPRGPINVGARAQVLPGDGSIPGLTDWKWLHTPGHAFGHISLFRAHDRALVVGDAFCTTKQESLLAVMQQSPELHGPPAYYTPDWIAAKHSVELLASLQPKIIAPAHGLPMSGPEMSKALHHLAQNFDRIARPEHGKYVTAD